MIKGTEDLHIFYANGQPSHCKYGNSMYTYVFSLQGDVLGLKDNTSALVVTYCTMPGEISSQLAEV